MLSHVHCFIECANACSLLETCQVEFAVVKSIVDFEAGAAWGDDVQKLEKP